MILYLSGSCSPGKKIPQVEPETILHDRAAIMLSYHLISIKGENQHKRFPQIIKARKERK